MATSLTRNLKLRLTDSLTADARYNLERLDLLGATFLVDTTNDLLIRSSSDIVIEPESADIGGSGTGGSVSIGSSDHPVTEFAVHADSISLDGNFGLSDTAVGGDKSLLLKYKSDIDGSVDTVADRSLFIDMNGANRNLVLGGDFSLLGASLSLTLPSSLSLTLPNGYGTPSQVLTTDGAGGLSWTTVSGGGGSGDVSGFTGSWVSGDGTSKVITHSLLSNDVEVQVIDDDDDQLISVDSIEVTNSNSVTLTSSEAPANSWRVVVQAK